MDQILESPNYYLPLLAWLIIFAHVRDDCCIKTQSSVFVEDKILCSARLLNRRADNLPLGKENSAKMHRKELTILKYIKCWNFRNCRYFTKQRPSALRQQLNWTHQINYAVYVTNLLFPKLSEHRRMNEWYFRTCKTNEAIWVSQFLDLLNKFLRAKTMHHIWVPACLLTSFAILALDNAHIWCFTSLIDLTLVSLVWLAVLAV